HEWFILAQEARRHGWDGWNWERHTLCVVLDLVHPSYEYRSLQESRL
ncbi:hypothetical protein SOVF_039990, partial [Spinacia oleracea]